MIPFTVPHSCLYLSFYVSFIILQLQENNLVTSGEGGSNKSILGNIEFIGETRPEIGAPS